MAVMTILVILRSLQDLESSVSIENHCYSIDNQQILGIKERGGKNSSVFMSY